MELFYVDIEFRVAVFAKDEQDAKEIVRENLHDITWGEEPEFFAQKMNYIENGFANSLPYSHDDEEDREIKEIFNQLQEEKKGKSVELEADKKQLKLDLE